MLLTKLGQLNKEEMSLKSEIEILENNSLSDNKLPYAVKNIINNHRLSGIHDILGKLIDTEEKYSSAIDIALGFTANVIVVDTDVDARNAIYFLKQNNLGRATFYPLNIMRPKGVDDNT